MSILLDFCNWLVMNFTGESGISSIASLATITALVFGIIKYLGRADRIESDRKNEEKAERERAAENINIELQDALEGLNRKKYPMDAFSFVMHDREYFYMGRTLNHDFYDSLIFSGKINFLEPKLQQPLQNIFQVIKTHNKYLGLVEKMYDESMSNKIPDKALKYYGWMDENEIKLLKDIPLMQKKLSEM